MSVWNNIQFWRYNWRSCCDVIIKTST